MIKRRICALMAFACALTAFPIAWACVETRAAAESETAEATQEETTEPTQEATIEPTQEATVEPTQEPTSEPTQEPTAEPSVTPEPTVYPTLQLGSTGDEVTALQTRLIALQFLDGTLEGMPTTIFDDATETAVKLFQKQNRLPETGVADDATQQLLYAENAKAYDPSNVPGGGGFPSGDGGGMTRGGSNASGAGEMTEEVGGITPGEALTSDHASGDEDMTRYWAVDIITTADRETQLTLGGTALDIALSDGDFTEEVLGGTLALTTESGTHWQVNGYALKLLSISGITNVTLTSGGESVTIPTEDFLSGSAYAALRAQGFVSKDFTLEIAISGGVTATVAAAGGVYEVDGATMAVSGLGVK